MKKFCEGIKIALQALIGAFAAIGLFEVMDLIACLRLGHYARMDGGVLENVLRDYIGNGALGYALGLMVIIYLKINKNEEKGTVQKTQEMLLVFWIIATVYGIIEGIIEFNLWTALALVLTFTIVFALAMIALAFLTKNANNSKKKAPAKKASSKNSKQVKSTKK